MTGREIYKLRDIERICHTKIRERKIPSAENITAKKADKILREAEAVIAQKNLDKSMEFIMERCSVGEYGALQYAAAFMKMKLGDELEEMKPERFAFDWMKQGRGRKGSKENERNRSGKNRNEKNRNDRSRNDRDRGERSRNSRYAAMRIKTKKS